MLAALILSALLALQTEVPDTLTVAVSGDIMMGTTYPSVRLPENDGKYIFKDVAPVLKDADIALGNLEGTLCDGGASTKSPGKYSYSFRTPTSYAPLLTEAGYDFLSMANNHSNDFGKTGMDSTEKALDGEGIAYSGVTGRREWVVVERSGVRFGIAAFGHNSYTLKHTNPEKVKSIVDTLVKVSDIVIISFHGGAEGSDRGHLPYGTETYLGENRGDLRAFAHQCIDLGADVVYGHGPHVTRCVEVYKGRLIAYSLGNFCTPYGVNISGVNGYAPVITARILRDGSFVDGKIHGFIQQYGKGPRTDAEGKVARHIKSLTDADVPASEAKVDEKGNIIKKKQ